MRLEKSIGGAVRSWNNKSTICYNIVVLVPGGLTRAEDKPFPLDGNGLGEAEVGTGKQAYGVQRLSIHCDILYLTEPSL